ncbi:hypothetical protein [Nonomuraea turcica]|uniref:hypothetical protein n=1 Tax=Nonomuraea sp. G32 TaxID=3067274 RepID=UPI00273CA977|nr:hypothetical protein [Nonomuraea sp. G32]MDP4512148.1 hypothetical protein [Nonomuraea sp. G32]
MSFVLLVGAREVTQLLDDTLHGAHDPFGETRSWPGPATQGPPLVRALRQPPPSRFAGDEAGFEI